MSFAHAGLGQITSEPNFEWYVFEHGNPPRTPATLYSDEDMDAEVSNSFQTDNLGNGFFYAQPGLYDLVPVLTPPGQNYFATTVMVPVNPLDAGSGGDSGGLAIYGDGSDGALILHDGDTWAPGNYTDVTIEAGATVTVAPGATNPNVGNGLPIYFGTGTFTILGTFDLRGTDATDRNGAVAPAGSGYTDGADASDGDGADAGKAMGANNVPLGGSGGNGTNGVGGIADTEGLSAPIQGVHNAIANISGDVTNWPQGGCSGAGDDTNNGGGGGSGGVYAILCFRHIVHGPDNLYLLKGGDGAPGGDDGTGSTGHGDCGGGGGGGNGWWLTISDDITGAANIDNTLGAGGAHCGTGANVAATVVGDSAPSTPLTVTTTVPGDGHSDTYVVAAGVYTTVAECVTAMGAAIGQASSLAFSVAVTPSNNAGKIKLTTVDTAGWDHNNDTITLGSTDVAADLGFTGNPDTFSGGTNVPTDGEPGQDGFVVHILNAA